MSGQHDQVVAMDGGSAGDRRVLSKDLAQRRRGKSGEALPDESTGGVVDLDRITPGELALYRRYPGGEKRPAVLRRWLQPPRHRPSRLRRRAG